LPTVLATGKCRTLQSQLHGAAQLRRLEQADEVVVVGVVAAADESV